MDIRQTSRTQHVLDELGDRVSRLRLQQNRTIAEVAEAAGIGTATLQRFESGKAGNLTTLVQVLRALHRLGDLDTLLQDVGVSPFAVGDGGSSLRQRASGSRGDGDSDV